MTRRGFHSIDTLPGGRLHPWSAPNDHGFVDVGDAVHPDPGMPPEDQPTRAEVDRDAHDDYCPEEGE